jgi:hypothetical protein
VFCYATLGEKPAFEVFYWLIIFQLFQTFCTANNHPDKGEQQDKVTNAKVKCDYADGDI